jgi:hypothetical protein
MYVRIQYSKEYPTHNSPWLTWCRLAKNCKIVNKQSPLFLQDLVQFRNSSYNFRYQNTLELSTPRTTRYGKNSFRYATATLWNSFPNHVREISNFNQFRSFLESWTGRAVNVAHAEDTAWGRIAEWKHVYIFQLLFLSTYLVSLLLFFSAFWIQLSSIK